MMFSFWGTVVCAAFIFGGASSKPSSEAVNVVAISNNIALSMDPTARCVVDADCGSTSKECVQVPVGQEGASKYCVAVQKPSMYPCEGPSPPPGSQCCSPKDCMHGPNPPGQCEMFKSCGGAQPPQINVCVYDECDAKGASTCADGSSCLPNGFIGFDHAICKPNLVCTRDADCVSNENGHEQQCLPFGDQSYCRGFEGFFCVNPKTAICTSDSDCTQSQYMCTYDAASGEPKCVPRPPPPP
eukprot:m.185408 g.185408  ORF g.185408 m.185408 type:complete len:242 (-) comp32234_c1_seq1:165-890(-)